MKTIAPTFDRALELLAEIAGPTYPLGVSPDTQRLVLHQLVADLYGKPVEEVTQAVEFVALENQRFHIETENPQEPWTVPPVHLKVYLTTEEHGVLELGQLDPDKKTAVLEDPHYINRSHQFRSDVVCSQELSDCRAWLEVKGFTVTEK